MLNRWSIRTTLTMVGGLLVALTVVVGVLGFTALNRASDSLDRDRFAVSAEFSRLS